MTHPVQVKVKLAVESLTISSMSKHLRSVEIRYSLETYEANTDDLFLGGFLFLHSQLIFS